ncbi:ATP/GTP-binding protein [Streptantibioticus parmotrematis]|uniref:ATP/GTP-binding protein n=1 Tax=Streptantibioticus parmotrematis TaxID=2873249 RepID=UPI0033E997DE
MLRTAALSAAATLLALAVPGVASADPAPQPTVSGPSNCGDMSVCIGVGVGGSPGSTHPGRPVSAQPGSGGRPKCEIKGTAVPCSDPSLGTFSNGCYYMKANPQPPAADPAWQGHKPGDGAIYNETCPYDPQSGLILPATGGSVWLQQPPNTAAVDPAQLAQQAVAKMRLGPPQINISPKPGGRGLVGMPVWMSVAKSATSWGPQSAAASAGGVTVTATAVVSQVVWSMGDGHSVTCTSPGTPYAASDGKASSPDCGYQYSQPSSSQPGGTYPVSATATWTIHWAGGGEQGDLAQTRTAQVKIAIAELQVVN